MSLHGTIEVNHHEIGWWAAQRVETHPSGRYRYKWVAEINGRKHRGDLWHDYDRGALALASAVLNAAHEAGR